MKLRSALLWALAFVLAAASAAYQRMTGPSYPVKGTLPGGREEITFRLPRSHGGDGDAHIRLNLPDTTVTGILEFRRFRSHDAWSRQPLERQGDALVAHIPHQPPAGKVMYRVLVSNEEGALVALTPEPVIIRFTGAVPAWVLASHVLIIFAGMFLSTRAGLEALHKGSQSYALTVWAILCLTVGGLVLGPVVQKYAFGAFWTGWPVGRDLTDNKIAVAVFFWLVALWRVWRNRSARGWVIAASLITLVVWLIPHSLMGSELDHT